MNIFSYLVTKNEADRYLVEGVQDLLEMTDGLLVYDDQSDDDTPNIAIDFGAAMWSRPNDVPPFSEDESAFRQAAWAAMEKVFQPEDGDWILTLDADEALFPYGRSGLEWAIAEALSADCDAIAMRVREVWEDTEFNLERVDGFWGSIVAVRLVAYHPNGAWSPKKEGGGSVPLYFNICPTKKIEIHHYGYARQADREAKYARYSEGKGHNRRHIQSILQTPELRPIIVDNYDILPEAA